MVVAHPIKENPYLGRKFLPKGTSQKEMLKQAKYILETLRYGVIDTSTGRKEMTTDDKDFYIARMIEIMEEL